MRLLAGALLCVALMAPAAADDSPAFLASAKDAATQLKLHLDRVAKAGGRPDFSTLPASDLFARVFDFKQLAALPPAAAKDVVWINTWLSIASQAGKSITYFGVSAPVDPVADQAAIIRNLTEYEDQDVAVFDFLIRVAAREVETMYLYMDQLEPEQRTPIREQGFASARVGAEEIVYGSLIMIAQGMKEANARRLSAAINDSRDVWVVDVLPKDRAIILAAVAKAEEAMNDEEARRSLASFAAALATAQAAAR